MKSYADLIRKAEQAQALLAEIAADPTLRHNDSVKATARFAEGQALRTAQALRRTQGTNERKHA